MMRVLATLKKMGVTELESVTSTMSTWRSNQLSYTPSIVFYYNMAFPKMTTPQANFFGI